MMLNYNHLVIHKIRSTQKKKKKKGLFFISVQQQCLKIVFKVRNCIQVYGSYGTSFGLGLWKMMYSQPERALLDELFFNIYKIMHRKA